MNLPPEPERKKQLEAHLVLAISDLRMHLDSVRISLGGLTDLLASVCCMIEFYNRYYNGTSSDE